jgi:hypothetical protein
MLLPCLDEWRLNLLDVGFSTLLLCHKRKKAPSRNRRRFYHYPQSHRKPNFTTARSTTPTHLLDLPKFRAPIKIERNLPQIGAQIENQAEIKIMITNGNALFIMCARMPIQVFFVRWTR